MSARYPHDAVRMLVLSLPVLAGLSISAAAHESRPTYIELRETTQLRYQLYWKIPPSVPSFNRPSVTLPAECEAQSPLAEIVRPDGVVRRISYLCAKELAGQAIAITYPAANPSMSSLVRYSTVSGEQYVAVLGPDEMTWNVPRAETPARVARQYALLGIEHIWGGIDHLLFLVCLLWIAGSWGRIFTTITGFTVAHSATLILSALQAVSLPIPPVEAAIALSIVFLAIEIVKGQRSSVTWRHPVAVSTSFGLLHGLGFAAALSEFGLPQKELVMGLMFFNVGVEIGQLAFAAGVIGSLRLTQQLGAKYVPHAYRETALRLMAGYAVGAVAVFWLIERGAKF